MVVISTKIHKLIVGQKSHWSYIFLPYIFENGKLLKFNPEHSLGGLAFPAYLAMPVAE